MPEYRREVAISVKNDDFAACFVKNDRHQRIAR